MKDGSLLEARTDLPASIESDGGASRNGAHATESTVANSSLPAIPVPSTETRWRTLSLSGAALVPGPHSEPLIGNPITLREEVAPAAFAHMFASLERQTVGLTAIGVTSAVMGEGKTTVALHLARTAAQSSYRRVCLVDLSLGEDELCRRVGAAPAPGGIIGFLESDGPLTVLQWPGSEQLSLFAAGKSPVNPARSARSPRIADLITALRDEYDLVIVDMPSVSTDNALPIARHLDGTIVVARAGATPRNIINSAVETLGRENIVGVILNQVAPPRKRRGAFGSSK